MENHTLCTAAAIAKDRLDQYLTEKLKSYWDTSAWEFYTFLLEQAQNHAASTSGYGPAAFVADAKQAVENYQKAHC
jgi:hypothetical protein